MYFSELTFQIQIIDIIYFISDFNIFRIDPIRAHNPKVEGSNPSPATNISYYISVI